MSSKSENWMPKPLDYDRIHESFEGYEGNKIEQYLKHQLSKAVVDLTYSEKSNDGRTNILIGTNLYGDEVCSTQVLNAKVTYNVDFSFINISVGNTVYTEGAMSSIRINKTDQVAITAKFKCIVTGNSGGDTFNETSALPLTFKWYTNSNGSYTEDRTLPSFTTNITPGEEVVVNLNTLFEYAFTNKALGVSYTIDDKEQTKYFSSAITLKSLQLSYVGEYLLRSNILTGLSLAGLDAGEDVSTYQYEYCLNSNKVLSPKQIPGNLTLDLGDIPEGINSLFIRVINSDKTLVSNDIQIDFIYQKLENSSLESAIALATSIPNSINNCDSSKLFTVVTTDKIYGTAKVVVIKSSNLGDLMGIDSYEQAVKSNYVFKEVEFDLQIDDASKKDSYNTYVEVEGYAQDEYIRVFSNNSTTSTTFYSRNVNGGIDLIYYKKINIINPKNGITHLLPVSNAILNFTQVNAGNVFTDLNPNLDESDGLQYEVEDNTSLQIFKASSRVFNEPKALLNKAGNALSAGPFTIEMLVKTYDCSDLNDEILSIGNIKLCPNYLYVYRSGEPSTLQPDLVRNASRADFQKNKKQHILITFDPAYKPSTYNKLYNELYKAGSVTYDEYAKPYPCLKIYVNGTINRTIQLTKDDLNDNGFNLQINPKNSNTNFYVFRTYDKVLTYPEIRQNYASTLLKLQEKELFYDINDILYNEDDFKVSELGTKKEILNTISLGKCLNKFSSVSNQNKSYINRRVLLLALPEGIKPPYYGNRKAGEPKATYLINYPNDLEHSGRLFGGTVKPQGSSAKKYMIHNPAYSGFTFIPESQWKNTEYTGVDYYTMPSDPATHIKKIVGKVNYASSMKSHKQGATKLFHDGYINMCGTTISTDWMNGGRKAVLEDDFLYFYVNVPEEDLDTLTWDYFKDESGNYNFENCHFLGFQTWGSGKGDKATSGYSDETPYYLMLEGADNANAAANFKTPWAAMQCWEDPTDVNSKFEQHSGKDDQGNPDYLTGLLINDETIVYNPGRQKENSTDKRADAWDVDFGADKHDAYKEDNEVYEFKDKAKVSLNRFAEFFNYIYKFDFSSLVFVPNGTVVDITDDDPVGAQTYNKLVFGDDCKILVNKEEQLVNPGDIYRWEKGWEDNLNAPTTSKWVPAGLYYDTIKGAWESLNIYDICNEYTLDTNSFFSSSAYNHLRSTYFNGEYRFFGKQQAHTPYNKDFGKDLVKIMAEAFKMVVAEYMDLDDVAYHQAFIRLVAGTDNRAKNTYFQIVGPIGTDESYEINAENLTKDFKIRLYQDDLDTIFKTDNNGQQVKPYYLLEPPFKNDLKELWGDLRSGFFHNFDIVFVEEVKSKLKGLLEFATNGSWPDSENTKFYQYFLSIQKGIPEIAYNHHSEIFYESAATLRNKLENGQYGNTEFYERLRDADNTNWKDFSNNQVASPLSLSHGSCYDAEVEYLKDRVLFLSTYAGGGKTSTDVNMSMGSTSSTSYASQYVVNSDYTSFIQYVYPTIGGLQINSDVSYLSYDSVIDLVSEDKDDPTENLVYNVAVPGNYSSINFSEKREGLTIGTGWENTDLYKTIYIKDCIGLDTMLTFPKASTIICQSSDYKINVGVNTEISMASCMKAVEHLVLQNSELIASSLNFVGCNKLKTLVLGKTNTISIPDVLNTKGTIEISAGEDCTGFNKVVLPNSNTLKTLILPSNIEQLTVGYYPDLTEVQIGHNIKSLIVDGRNSQEVLTTLLNALVTGPGSTLYITNIPEQGIWLEEDVCVRLTYVEDLHIEGTIKVGLKSNNTTTQISFNTKKQLVEKFGNIDSSSNKVKFTYSNKNISTISTSTTATIQGSGPAPINLQVDGNNVKIDGSQLKIKYELLTNSGTTVTSSDISINPVTGYLTITEGHEGTYVVKVTVWYSNTSKSSTTNLTVGFYVPKVGDFAYANGTFNTTYDSSLALVGMVYYVYGSGTNYDVWVLGNETIQGLMGPSYYYGPYDDSRKQKAGFYASVFGASPDSSDLACYKDLDRGEGYTIPSGTVYYNTDVSTYTSVLKNQKEEAVSQREYLQRVNEYTAILNQVVPNFPVVNQLNTEVLNPDDSVIYNEVYNKLNSITEVQVSPGNTYYKSSGVDFTTCLYPVIVNTLYYQPKNLSGKGVDYYKTGVWYVPTVHDISVLLYHRIRGAMSNYTNTEQHWNSTKKGISYNELSSDVFSHISFFKTQQYYIKSVNCASGGYAYTYQQYYWDEEPRWINSPSSTEYSYRDIYSTVYPCCCIKVSK